MRNLPGRPSEDLTDVRRPAGVLIRAVWVGPRRVNLGECSWSTTAARAVDSREWHAEGTSRQQVGRNRMIPPLRSSAGKNWDF